MYVGVTVFKFTVCLSCHTIPGTLVYLTLWKYGTPVLTFVFLSFELTILLQLGFVICRYGTPILTFSCNLLDYVIVLPVYLACVTCFRILMYVRVPCPWAPKSRSLKFFLLQKSALLFLWLVRGLRSRRGRLWNGWGLQRCKTGILISFILVLDPRSVSQRNVPIILKRPAFHSGLRRSGLISWKSARSLGTFSVLR